MIPKESVTDIVTRVIEGKDMFLVDVKVSKSNVINVFIDSMEGITIKECAEVSRHIENYLSREQEDYELNVSSPGLDMPLRIKQQYDKNIGKTIEVLKKDQSKVTGTLIEVKPGNITLEYIKKIKENNKKKEVTEQVTIDFEDINQSKIVISF